MVSKVARRVVGFVLVGCALAILIPFAWLIVTAVAPSDVPVGRLVPGGFTLRNFSRIFSGPASYPFLRWVVNSLFVSGSATVLVVVLDVLAAFSLARLEFPGRRVLFGMVVASLAVPFIALFVPLYVEFSDVRLLNTYWALIMPYTGNAFGVLLLYQFFRGIPRELEEAARLEGATNWRVLMSVCVPAASPVLATLAVLSFMLVYNDFFWPLVATSTPMLRTVTVGIEISGIGAYSDHFRLMMAMTTLSCVPMVCAFVVAQRRLVAGLTFSGVQT